MYETPLNAWKHGDWIVVALTYGDEVDWLKNTQAAEASAVLMGGEVINVGPPVDVATEDGMALVSLVARIVLPLIKVDQFVEFPIISRPS